MDNRIVCEILYVSSPEVKRKRFKDVIEYLDYCNEHCNEILEVNGAKANNTASLINAIRDQLTKEKRK